MVWIYNNIDLYMINQPKLYNGICFNLIFIYPFISTRKSISAKIFITSSTIGIGTIQYRTYISEVVVIWCLKQNQRKTTCISIKYIQIFNFEKYSVIFSEHFFFLFFLVLKIMKSNVIVLLKKTCLDIINSYY